MSRFEPGLQAPATLTPGARWFVVGHKGLWAPEGSVLPPDADALAAAGLSPEGAHYLGRLDGEDMLAIAHDGEAAPPGMLERGLRSLYGKIDETGFALAGRAVQIVEWDRTHRHCGRCGAATERHDAERVRACPACGLRVFPRVAPAVIVLVRRPDGRALLAQGSNRPFPFFSTLAGFVEPGESIEECIAREIREEVGVEVTNFRYFGSQPWPFPHSLMIGFFADWAGGEIRIDPAEIAAADWFDVDALPPLPSGISIARKLIDAWIAERTR